jgi:hypothetical protein
VVREKTTTTENGTKVVRRSAGAEPVKEWRLQGAAVRRLRRMRGYGVDFTIAGDMNAGKRGPRAQLEAKITGMEPGEPDLRVYLRGGRLGLIEFKTSSGRLSEAQRFRHQLLRGLGFDVVVVQVATEAEAEIRCEALIKAWLGVAANDNDKLPGVAPAIAKQTSAA